MNEMITPVATGDRWIGSGIRSSSSVIRELIIEAEKEIILTAYLLTNTDVTSQLQYALDKGVKVIVYISRDKHRYDLSNAVCTLYGMSEKYPYLHIIEISSVTLHAKVIITDGKRIYCGSANLSESGINRNYELGLLVEDSVIACKIRDLIQIIGR